MKNILYFLTFLFFSSGVLAQAPQVFNYQAVLRGEAGQPMASEQVSVQIDLKAGSPEGTVVFTETHDTQTNAFGLINLQIGSVESLEDVQWENDLYFIEISIDGTIMGSSQLLSVPFALHSATSADVFSGDYLDLENTPDLSNFINVEEPQTGDMLIYSSEGWQKLPIGEEGHVLQIIDGVIQWAVLEIDDNGGGEEPDPGFMTDSRDGQQYSTVTIGTQRWLAENLNYYTPEGSWYYANDSLQYAQSYGRMYTWYTAMDGAASGNDNPSGIQGVCPPGWHLPSDAEWDELILALDSETPGNLLKETGTEHWQSTNEFVTNESGFTARAGGRRVTSGTFGSITSFGLWWSTKERADSTGNAWTRYIIHNSANVTRFSSDKAVAVSVRCIED